MFANVVEFFDSGVTRDLGYLMAAALAGVRFGLEHRGLRPRPVSSWPVYWMLSAILLTFLGLSRATRVGGLIADVGRNQARSEGWYDARRTLQAAVVVVIAATWLIGVVIAVWRVPPRRRRYLPSVIMISALVAFAFVRVVSLHHIDALLYRRDVGGVRFVAVIELGLLAMTITTIVLVPRLVDASVEDE
jgi:hypothetical protein